MCVGQNHLEASVKCRLLGSAPEFLIQYIWVEPDNLHL